MVGDLSDDTQVFIVAIDEASLEVHPWDTPLPAPWRTPAPIQCTPGPQKTGESMIHQAEATSRQLSPIRDGWNSFAWRFGLYGLDRRKGAQTSFPT